MTPGESNTPAPPGPAPFICADCGSRTAAATYAPRPLQSLWWVGVAATVIGYFTYWLILGIGLGLVAIGFVLFVIAGARTYTGCNLCASRNLVPSSSPRGEQLIRQFSPPPSGVASPGKSV